jgi:hypothetical protein
LGQRQRGPVVPGNCQGQNLKRKLFHNPFSTTATRGVTKIRVRSASKKHCNVHELLA